MRTKDAINEQYQRQRLLTTAWELFRKKGYLNTTMEDILKAANCSKGRFYYYYSAKSELLDSLYHIFDEKYLEAYKALDSSLTAVEKFIAIDTFVFNFMETEIGYELLSNLYISQLNHSTGIDFWSPKRIYLHILNTIVTEGQEKKQLRCDLSSSEIVTAMVSMERSVLLDWCLSKGNFSLSKTGPKKVSLLFQGYEL